MTPAEQLQRRVETLFNCVEGIPSHLSQTGEPYTVIAVTGPTVEAAIDGWWDRFVDYTKGKTGTLYWRRKPEVDEYGHRWRVYARLLVSADCS